MLLDSMKRMMLVSALTLGVVSSCISCAGFLGRGSVMPTPKNVAHSITKITTRTTVDTSLIAVMIGEESVVVGSMGTAFVVDEFDGKSLVATAGHMCESSKTYHTDLFGELPIIKSTYTLDTADGEEMNATVLFDDDRADICVLLAEKRVGRPLKISSRDPDVGVEAYYAGAPGGYWPEHGVVPVFEGIYSGTATQQRTEDTERDWILVTVWGEGGASGSPVFVVGYGIIGVLTNNSHAQDGGGNVTVGASWKELRTALAAARKACRKIK